MYATRWQSRVAGLPEEVAIIGIKTEHRAEIDVGRKAFYVALPVIGAHEQFSPGHQRGTIAAVPNRHDPFDILAIPDIPISWSESSQATLLVLIPGERYRDHEHQEQERPHAELQPAAKSSRSRLGSSGIRRHRSASLGMLTVTYGFRCSMRYSALSVRM
jgi:hypothetical protein